MVAVIDDVPDRSCNRVDSGPFASELDALGPDRQADMLAWLHAVAGQDRKRAAVFEIDDRAITAPFFHRADEEIGLADEFGDEAGRRVVVDLDRPPDLFDPAIVQDGDAV